MPLCGWCDIVPQLKVGETLCTILWLVKHWVPSCGWHNTERHLEKTAKGHLSRTLVESQEGFPCGSGKRLKEVRVLIAWYQVTAPDRDMVKVSQGHTR